MKWIIVISNSAVVDAYVAQTEGTIDTIKEKLLSLMLEDVENDKENFDFGHETVDELVVEDDKQVMGFNVFNDYHINYIAIKIDSIETI